MTLPAIEQAITFLSRADLIVTARQQSLPAGVTEILKISSGDQDALLAAQESTRFSQDDVRHAAQFYVQQILFAPDSDHYRILGVDADDPEAKIKLHYRLLVRWLHPDKNSSDWEVVYSDRVNRAWHSLRTPERRREYDAQLQSLIGFKQAPALENRKLEPAHLRRNNANERYMSSRAIKRLPVAVFGLLGVSAILALWWFSQLQPQLTIPVVASADPPPDRDSAKTLTGVRPTRKTPPPEVSPDESRVWAVAATESTREAPVESTVVEKPAIPQGALDNKLIVGVPTAKTSEPEMDVKLSSEALAPTIALKKIKSDRGLHEAADSGKARRIIENEPAKKLAMEDKANAGTGQKNRLAKLRSANAPVSSNANAVAAPVVAQVAANTAQNGKTADNNDANVRQFLQQFSRVYADGDYFALHNLFTRDLSIISAGPQRNVLHSYRQLFENSQSREIALDHVTWLVDEENIVVIASYQTQVLPRGKSETKSSRGDIRLDLRMENGQLRIVRLQSDTKNG